MRIGEVAGAAGVNVETLRYYERRGLLAKPARSRSGYREYTPDAVRVLRFVKRAQELGFTLREIADLLRLSRGGPESCAAVRALATRRLADLGRKIAMLKAMRRSLQRLVRTCERPRARRECPLLESLDEAARETTADAKGQGDRR